MDATRRRRQPALVRAALLDAAVQEAMVHGVGNVTVLSVAARAGVSKGALFHHFANRQDLLEAAYAECLARFGDALDVLVATDPVPHGRFTRAYVRAFFDQHLRGEPQALLDQPSAHYPEVIWEGGSDGDVTA